MRRRCPAHTDTRTLSSYVIAVLVTRVLSISTPIPEEMLNARGVQPFRKRQAKLSPHAQDEDTDGKDSLTHFVWLKRRSDHASCNLGPMICKPSCRVAGASTASFQVFSLLLVLGHATGVGAKGGLLFL